MMVSIFIKYKNIKWIMKFETNQLTHTAIFKAWSISAIKSSASSNPTESLKKLSVIPNIALCSAGTVRWLIIDGCSINDSNPPSDMARAIILFKKNIFIFLYVYDLIMKRNKLLSMIAKIILFLLNHF